MSKREIRAAFRKAVFTRDRFRCRCCGVEGADRQAGASPLPALDAHHITSRDLLPNGGYVVENGISLCADCHVKAEVHWSTGTPLPGFAPADLYRLIGSTPEAAESASRRLSKG